MWRCGLCKVGREAQCCSSIWDSSIAQELEKAFLKVRLRKQYRGTGGLERNFPGHIWKMRMKRAASYWKFWVCAVRWIPGRRIVWGWLLKPSVSVCVAVFSCHLPSFTTLRETGRPSTAKILLKLNCIWYTFLLVWDIVQNIKYFYLPFLLKKIVSEAVTPCLPSLSVFTHFKVVKTCFPSN